MPVVNYMAREVSFKVVFCGAPMAGKTTCLRKIDQEYPQMRGKPMYPDSRHPSTVSLDFLPRGLGQVKGFSSRIYVWTLNGASADESVRKALLKGVDAIVFVADSHPSRMEANVAAREEVRRHLAELGIDPKSVPVSMFYNKRDLPDAVTVGALSAALNPEANPWLDGIATEGGGVLSAVKECFKTALIAWRDAPPPPPKPAAPPAPAPAPKPPPAPPVDIARELDKTMLVIVLRDGMSERRFRFNRHQLTLGRPLPTLTVGEDIGLAHMAAHHAHLIEREGVLEFVPVSESQTTLNRDRAPIKTPTRLAVGDVLTLTSWAGAVPRVDEITIEAFEPMVPPDFETVEAAFLAPMKADPSDIATRLVYADVLDEKGYLVRAEWLRLQVRHVLGERIDGDGEAWTRLQAKLAPATRWKNAIGWPTAPTK